MVKKNIKKRKFCKPYVFYGILVFLGIVLVLFFIYGLTSPKSKISGKAVLGDYIDEASCVVAGYIWENLINETCTNVTICINETIINCECLEYEDINGTQGDCINWSSCINETCTDEENCVPVIISGQCIGDVCSDGDCNAEENVWDEVDEEIVSNEILEVEQDIILNETEEIIEELTNTLTDEERKILIEEFGNISTEITKNELIDGRIIIRHELDDYWFEPSYDSDLSKEDLELQIQSERIKWLKDIANTLFTKRN